MKTLISIEQYQLLKDSSKAGNPILIMKHSTQCPRSAQALKELESFVKDSGFPEAYVLDLLELRPISNFIEQDTGVRHESPQIFLFYGGNMVWHAHHWDVTSEKITNALATHSCSE